MTDAERPMNLAGFEPSEEDLYQIAISEPLPDKIEKAVGLLKLYEPKDEPYHLAYSGGKDSGAILELAKMAGVRFEPWYNCTTIDPPELVRFIKRVHPEVKWNRPKMHLWTRLGTSKSNGPPTRLSRWCCEEYKEQGGTGRTKILGIRTEESARRKGLWRQVVPHRKSGLIINPILFWTDADVWQFHRERNIPYCELYDQGFKRLGCVGCPLAGPAMQAVEFARWPRYRDGWRKAIFKYVENWRGVPTLKGKPRWFEDIIAPDGDPERLWQWWITGKAQQGEPSGCQGEFMFATEDET